MKDIAIYGAGGLGREVIDLINKMNEVKPQWNIIGFFDDSKPIGEIVTHDYKVLGGIDEVNAWSSPLCVALCMGSPHQIEAVFSKITNPLIEFPNLIYQNFYISDRDTFSIGHGNIICGKCVATVSVTIGNFNLLNGSVTFGHDVTVGDYNVFMPGCRISGEVKIGNRNLFGAMSFVKQCLKIGNDVTLSPLSPLLSKPKDGNTYMGNPAKIFKF